MCILKFVCGFALLCTVVESAKILGIVHVPGYSHYIIGETLFKELAAKGHEVTVISSFPQKAPVQNYKDVPLTGFVEAMEEKRQAMFDQMTGGPIAKVLIINFMGIMLSELVLNHTNVQQLLKSNEKFDLIIMEQFQNEAFRGFQHHYGVPVIILGTIGASRWVNPQVGNPGPPSVVPDLLLSFSSHMNFFERMYNSIFYAAVELFRQFYVFPKHNEIMQKYFPGAPNLNTLYYNTSLVLLNSHVSTNEAVPYVPNMIDIGGMHVKAPKKLPKDIQQFLDDAKDGAIFFSMGSNLHSSDLPEEKRKAILNTFAKLKQKVLWKWESDTLPGQPPNVKLGKWLPQQDILAHPNIKLFITHGGFLSTVETIYHGVPVVGVPVFGDQDLNVANIVVQGFGVGVPYKQLTEKTLTEAIQEVINNNRYRENAKKRSKIMHDRPMPALDTGVYWVEYVLKHKGATHLRTAALDLYWYQYFLLDVLAFVSVAVFIFVGAIFFICKKLCCRAKSSKSSDKKKRN